ncbi:nuclear speckle splicing regulatory protein 1 [Pseudophryne corroboree]|uniref:nuclear speckle splicing regulatory protein 1 n=1 Tax=Pseudophryne corroboree TaxID=495146 RepID=UPI003081FA20
MAAPGKQYGLIIPKKLLQKNVCLPKHSAFADDSDDELSVGESLQKESVKKRLMKQTKLEVQKALAEDTSVYEYDSVYDDIQKKKEENAAKVLSEKDRKPKYIQNILKAVEVRKKEQEKRMEKKIQKEREMEGDEFQDKEAFVTSAYKQKLQEKADEEEREKREAALEASLDVTKQKDLSGFYRHLLNQTVGEEETPECSLRETGVKKEEPKGYSDEPKDGNPEDNIDADSDLGTESSEDEKDITAKKPPTKSNHSDREEKGSKTHGRPQHSSSSSEELDDHHKLKGRYKGTNEVVQPEKDKYNQQDYDRDFKGELQERAWHGEHDNKDWHRRREDQDSQVRAKERREHESGSRDGRKEKGSHRKEENERYTEKERDRGKKHKERIDDEKRRNGSDKEHKERERADKSERERPGKPDKERVSKADKEHGEMSDKGKKYSELEKKDRSPSPAEMQHEDQHEMMPDSKHKVEETLKVANKFAKRSNEETLGSARDRYLARQMARAGDKAHVEKEED